MNRSKITDVDTFDFPLNSTEITMLFFNYKTPKEIERIKYP